MVSMAGAVITTSRETGPEQPPANPREQLRPLEAAQCSLCGVALPLGLLVPDGGPGCPDIRWYCKDAKSCTERWTAAGPSQHPPRPAVPAPAPVLAPVLAAAPVPVPAPAERLDGALEASA
jgi:hypothetical protein